MTPDELSALKAQAQQAQHVTHTTGKRVADPLTVLALIAEIERLHARDAIAAEVAAGAIDRTALIARIEALEQFIYDAMRSVTGDDELLKSVRAHVEARNSNA